MSAHDDEDAGASALADLQFVMERFLPQRSQRVCLDGGADGASVVDSVEIEAPVPEAGRVSIDAHWPLLSVSFDVQMAAGDHGLVQSGYA